MLVDSVTSLLEAQNPGREKRQRDVDYERGESSSHTEGSN